MKAYAICDTDGGRQARAPAPLLRHIYPTHETAESARKYHGLASEWYPIREIEISLWPQEDKS